MLRGSESDLRMARKNGAPEGPTGLDDIGPTIPARNQVPLCIVWVYAI